MHNSMDPVIYPQTLSARQRAGQTSGHRLIYSKAFIPVIAVSVVTVAALAATLAVKHSDAGENATPPTAARVAADTRPATADGRAAGAADARRATPAARSTVAAACTGCGVVQSVSVVTHARKPSGAGAVAGGVVGGLLGNTMGGGTGRVAMTVLGAVGGGFAGNAIEKNMSKQTAYQVRVRMDDGTTRTLEQASSFAVGARVVVEGQSLRLADGATS